MNFLRTLAVLLSSLLLLAPIAAADELLFKNLELKDDEVAPGSVLELTFDLENPSSKDYKDVIASAQIKGKDDTKITKEIGTISAGSKREEKKITVNVPDDLREGQHTLVLKAKGVLKGVGTKTTTTEISFTVEQKDYSVYIKKVELSDETLLAGTSVDIAVKIANNGKNDLQGLKLQVEIPELGTKQAVKLSELGQENEQNVYLTLDVPESAQSGLYTLKTSVSNAQASDLEIQDVQVTKVAAKVVETTTKVVPKEVSTPPVAKLNQGAVISLDIKNNQNTKKTYDLVLGGVADWTSSARIDPSSVTLEAGQSQTANVYVLPKASGDKSFTLYVKDGPELVSAIQVNVKVDGQTSAKSQIPNASWAFVVLVLIIAIVAAWVYKKNGQRKLGQVYY